MAKATFQTRAITGRTHVTVPRGAGETHEHVISFTLSANYDASEDLIEMFALPAGAYITEARLVAENLLAGDVIDIGFMSGEVGDATSTRTSGDELFDGVAGNAAESVVGLAALAAGLGPFETATSIGAKIVQDVTGAANKKIHLKVAYRF